MFNNLLKNTNVVRVSADGAGSASATPSKGTIIDMAGYDSVMFIALMGNVLDTSAVALKAAGAATNSTGAMALLTGSAAGTASATSFDDKLVILDVVRPPYRYIEAQLFHVTADAPFDGIVAVQYNARDVPVTQGATVAAAALSANPVLA